MQGLHPSVSRRGDRGRTLKKILTTFVPGVVCEVKYNPNESCCAHRISIASLLTAATNIDRQPSIKGEEGL